MQNVENKTLSRIHGNGRGWAFSRIDFSDLAPAGTVDSALSRLSKSGKIRRIQRGLYDYPQYSNLLETPLNPDFDQVARAIARKNRWSIQPNGPTALNLLGLSTQVTGTVTYLSDGPTKTINIANLKIHFKNTKALRETKLKHRCTELTVQALKTLGKDRVNETVIKKLRNVWTVSERKKMLKDAKYVTSWIYEKIKIICREDRHE